MEQDDNIYLCKKCGVRAIDKSESKYSILCTSCREEQIRYPIPKLLLLAISVVLVLVVSLCVVTLPDTIKEYKEYQASYDNISAGNVNEIIDNDDKINIKADDAVDLFVDAMERGQYDYASYIYDTYLYSKKVSDSDYDKVDAYMDKLDAYCYTWTAYEEILGKLDQNLTDEEYYAEAKNQLKALLDNPTYDEAIIYYFLGAITSDYNEAKEYFQSSISSDDKFQESKVELANLLRRNKEMDEAKKMLNEVLEIDSVNSGALRGLAIINMLNNDMEEAVTLAKEAYESNKNGYYVYETLIIALHKNGQVEEGNKYMEEYSNLGYELEEDTKMLLNNEMTLEEYYLTIGEVM